MELVSENTGGGKLDSSVKSMMESLSGVSGGGKSVRSGDRDWNTHSTQQTHGYKEKHDHLLVSTDKWDLHEPK